jgi:Protein of unknown function (DUF3592)
MRAARETASLPAWKRVVGAVIPAAVRLALWGAGVLFVVAGLLTWLEWRSLADRGVDSTARIERCEWKSVGGAKRRSATSGYYACTYSYRIEAEGPAHRGSFQTSRSREPGDPEPIRFLPESPDRSAAVEDLQKRPWTPGAIAALGAAWLGGLGWRSRKSRRERPPAGP